MVKKYHVIAIAIALAHFQCLRSASRCFHGELVILEDSSCHDKVHDLVIHDKDAHSRADHLPVGKHINILTCTVHSAFRQLVIQCVDHGKAAERCTQQTDPAVFSEHPARLHEDNDPNLLCDFFKVIHVFFILPPSEE